MGETISLETPPARKKYLSKLSLKNQKKYLRSKVLLNKKYIRLFRKAEHSLTELVKLKITRQKMLYKDLNRYNFQGAMRLIITQYYKSTPEVKALLAFQKNINSVNLKNFSDPDYLPKLLLVAEKRGRGWAPNSLLYPFINYYGSVENTRIYLENDSRQQHNLDFQLLQRSGGTKIYPGSFSKGCMINVNLARKPYDDIVRLSLKKAIGFYRINRRGYRNSNYWAAINYRLTVSQMALLSRKLHAMQVATKPASFFTRSAQVKYDPNTKILTITNFYKKATICFKASRGTWYKLSTYELSRQINKILSINGSKKYEH